MTITGENERLRVLQTNLETQAPVRRPPSDVVHPALPLEPHGRNLGL